MYRCVTSCTICFRELGQQVGSKTGGRFWAAAVFLTARHKATDHYSAFIDSEVSGVGRGMAIWSDGLRVWEAPCENDSINEEERHRIISRVARALELDGATVKVLT
jgi:hypothetical protein